MTPYRSWFVLTFSFVSIIWISCKYGLRNRLIGYMHVGSGVGEFLIVPLNTRMEIRTCSPQERKMALKSKCQALPPDADVLNYNNLVVDDNHQVIYCPIPKVGSTSWYKLMVVSSPVIPEEERNKQNVHNNTLLTSAGVTSITWYNATEVDHIIKTYKKVFVVRNPFKRLLSAYLDKCIRQNNVPENYLNGLEKVFGKLPEFDGHHFLPFEQFLRMLIISYDDHTVNFYANMHFKSQLSFCDPCLMEFDYMLRMETFEDDLKPVMKIFNDIQFPERNAIPEEVRNVFNFTIPSFEEAYKDIPQEVMDGLARVYKRDFEIFGYTSDLSNGPVCLYEDHRCC